MSEHDDELEVGSEQWSSLVLARTLWRDYDLDQTEEWLALTVSLEQHPVEFRVLHLEAQMAGYDRFGGWLDMDLETFPDIDSAYRAFRFYSADVDLELFAYEPCPADTDGDGDCASCARTPTPGWHRG